MNQLGKDNIPITGSAAALHRKQQLEYQVPPHDLDPNLCHNLTNTEKILFEEHVAKVMSNSGQGYVTRLGLQKASKIHIVNHEIKQIPQNSLEKENIQNMPFIESIKNDKILQQVLCSELVKGVRYDVHKDDLINKNTSKSYKQETCLNSPDFINSPFLCEVTKDKLIPMKINSESIRSAVLHGWYYDKLFEDLDSNKLDYSNDLLLHPIKAFRAEYLQNDAFKTDTDNFAIISSRDILTSSTNVTTNPEYIEKQTDNHNDDTIPIFSENNDHPPKINYSNHPFLSKIENGLAANISQSIKPSSLNLSKPLQIVDNKCIEKLIDLNEFEELHISSREDTPSILCQRCTLQIHSNEIVVQTEKNGKQVAWHPKCFVCFSCNELLADLVYFLHKGNIYCARDFAAILKIPRCKACDELIFTKEYTVAENASFHVRHFCCFHCDTPLADQNYVSDDKSGQPVCLPCYENYQAEKCQSCQKPIAANEQGVAWSSLHWHTYCFNCAGRNCNKSLLGGRFMVKNSIPLCSPQCFASLNN